jgi:ABC-type transporter Mla maintaining outer membrane lipid asymmetry permease subunit MlaE
VGQSTTHAVVGGIILVIAADSVFAVIFNVIGL